MDRVVLGRRENTMVGFRWTGAEPDGLTDDKLAEEFGAVWEGDELVTYGHGIPRLADGAHVGRLMFDYD